MTSSLSGLPTLYSQFIYKSRYARWLPEENRREDWAETVARYLDFMTKHLKENFKYEIGTILHKQLFDAIYNLEVMPSMRALMTAGEALEKYHVAGYNCCYLSIDHPRAFDEILYILMNGTGVGFSVEQNSIDKLPIVNEHFEDSSTTIIVDDSKGGWAKAFRELIAMLYAGQVPTWDLTKLRPAGARLKTFGGRSSGPVPLDALFKFTVEKFKAAAGRKLTPLEAHDIVCKIADIVVVGGVRRSALISLSNLNDRDMQDAKSGRWWDFEGQRALANNSATYTRKPDVLTFLKEWTALIQSQSGERGIFNRDAAKRQVIKAGRRDPNHAWGTNPCSEIILRPNQFCVAGDTKLITNPYGITEISKLVDTEVNIWNGEEWTDVTIRKTGSNQKLVRVTLSDGSYLDCTPDHRFSVKDRFQKNWSEVTADKLMDFSKYSVQVEPGNVKGFEDGISLKNPYTLGFVVGDGCIYKDRVTCTLYGEKDFKCPILGTRAAVQRKKNYNIDSCDVYIPKDTIDCNLASILKHDAKTMEWLAKCSRKDILAFVAGLADADGSQVPSGGIRIYISDEDRARALQLVLTRCGIKSSVCLQTPKGFITNYGARKKAMWYLQVTECNDIPCHRLDTSKGHKALFKGQYQNVVSVVFLEGLHDTYCFNEPKKHKGLFGNILTYQCNLSEVVVRHNDTYETLAEKVRLATILGTFQSTLTDFKYLRKIWKDNTEEERLLGVSMTGIMDNDNLSKEMLGSLKQVAITTNVFLAAHLKINPSTAITCVKPSGTVSQLVDSASGIHPRHSEYYIRTVRGDKKDPLTTFMIAKGIPNEPCVMKPNDTVIFSFPQKAPEGAVTRNQLSSIRHLQEWLLFQRHWCEHKPSVTINVKDADWLTVGAWVYDHFDEVSGISFLPHSEHTYKQAPYQECTKEEYEALLAKMPEAIDWTELSEYEKEDTTTGTQELSCVAGYCEVINIGA